MLNFVHASFLLMLPRPSEVAALISFISQPKKLKLHEVTMIKRLSFDWNQFLFYSKAQANNHRDKPLLSGSFRRTSVFMLKVQNFMGKIPGQQYVVRRGAACCMWVCILCTTQLHGVDAPFTLQLMEWCPGSGAGYYLHSYMGFEV